MLGEAPIGPPPKSPVGRLIGAASVHLPRAGAVSFDERYYPVPNPRQLSRFSRRRTPSAVSRSVFATIREEFQNTKDKAACSGFWTGRGPWFKSFRGRSWPADDRINWLKMLVMGRQIAYGADDEIEIKKKEAANGGGLTSCLGRGRSQFQQA